MTSMNMENKNINNTSEQKESQMAKRATKAEDMSAWYLWVVQEAQLADYSPVKGCMVIRPNGYGIWENIQRIFDQAIKKMGVRNAYFPLFIPESFLHREKAHVEGFSPELAVVTIGGGERLDEPLVVRPTSETIMYDMYAKWVKSWRDLPVLINQWCNVVRWEKRTFPFLRTLEFLWQEGHTAHETLEEADAMTMQALEAYRVFIEDTLAIPVIVGKKSEGQKFAGALYTTTCEALMPDGKALQSATSHNLGQNFSKAEAFDISFQTANRSTAYVWQTSWGLSTRIIGALIMTHGDDRGLVLPPKIAPLQIVVVPIYKDTDREQVVAEAERIAQSMNGEYTIHVDVRDGVTPGYKFHDWELQGIPLRFEVGPREVTDKTVVVVRRDTGEKVTVVQAELKKIVNETLAAMQRDMLLRAQNFLQTHTFTANSLEEFIQQLDQKRGFVVADWCGEAACEDRVKAETKATARAIPFNTKPEHPCFVCGKPAKHRVYWARAY
jgi:prolyl-tRNA synthetase